MNSNLLMNFSVDRENKKINVEREFAAPLENVWAAWTQQELLDQWWAPKPWKAETKSMDFRSGGHWLYAMKGPEGEVHWSRADFESVVPKESFEGLDAFCDSEGNINPEMPRSNWRNDFKGQGEHTVVYVTITFDNTEQLDGLIKMGFKEGFTMGLQNLDELLASKK